MADPGFDSSPRKVELMTESICGIFHSFRGTADIEHKQHSVRSLSKYKIVKSEVCCNVTSYGTYSRHVLKWCIHLLRYPPQQPHIQPQVEVHLGNGVPSIFPRPRAGMWPQLPPQQLAVDQSEKQREYLKQQQKLRLMTPTSTAVCIFMLVTYVTNRKNCVLKLFQKFDTL